MTLATTATSGWRMLEHRGAMDARHDFLLRMPSHLQPTRVPCDPPEETTSRRMALFVSEQDPDVVLEVRCTRVEAELDPLDLLETHLLLDGAEVLSRTPAWGPGGHTGNLLVERAIHGGRGTTLARVEKDAELIYFLFAHTTANGYPARADMLREIVDSFRLLRPRGGLAEELLFGGARFPIDHSFLFPASFQLVVDEQSNAAVGIYELVHIRLGPAAGTVAIVVIAREETGPEEPEPVALWMTRSFRRRGVELGVLTLQAAPPVCDELPTYGACGEGQFLGAVAETELCIGRHPQGWIVIARVTPGRRTNPHAWLANRRAFAIVRERFAALPRPIAPEGRAEVVGPASSSIPSATT